MRVERGIVLFLKGGLHFSPVSVDDLDRLFSVCGTQPSSINLVLLAHRSQTIRVMKNVVTRCIKQKYS